MTHRRSVRWSAAVLAAAVAAAGFVLLRPASPAAVRPAGHRAAGCDMTVADLGAIRHAVAASPDGSVICVASGRYGPLVLDATRSGYVTLRGETDAPRDVSFADLDFGPEASHIRVEAVSSSDKSGIQIESADDERSDGANHISLYRIYGDWVQANAGTHDLAIERSDLRNVTLSSTDHRIPGAPLFSDGCGDLTSWEAPVSNVVIRGNRFHRGSFEDYVRLSNYRNVLVEGNEATGLYENGEHMTFVQTAWGGRGLTIRKNWGHDNSANFVFLGDGQTYDTVIEDNIYVRNRVNPHGYPYLNRTAEIYNPRGLVFSHNTLDEPGPALYPVSIYRDSGKAPCTPELPPTGVHVSYNVTDLKAWDSDTSSPLPIDSGHDLFGTWTENWVKPGAGDRFSDDWRFKNEAHDDWRLAQRVGGRWSSTPGVDWRPADQRYGP